MSTMQRNPVAAIVCSDVHLSLKPPIARAEEPDWFAAMARPWKEIKQLAKKYSAPILVAGDVFDRWNAPPELINWAIETLPKFYAIPGQHDLPNHRANAEDRSAYGTLVRVGTILPLTTDPIMEGNMMRGILLELTGFPYGTRVRSPDPENSTAKVLKIALVHEFLWIKGSTYYGAPKQKRLHKKMNKFNGFDIVVVGDNHKPFEIKLKGGATVFNCGSLIRRKSDEIAHRPRVGLIRASGKIQSYELNTEKDVITRLVGEDDVESGDNSSLREFVQELASLELTPLNFRDTIIAAMGRKKTTDQVRDLIMEAMEK